MNPHGMISAISRAVSSIRAIPPDEARLQDMIACCFRERGIPYAREVFTATGPVDFVAWEEVAIEVKMKGSAVAVNRQLLRYLEDARFLEAVLITTRPMVLPLRRLSMGGGAVKPIHVVDMWKNFL